MHRFYFPACPVDGPVEPPVAYGHLGSRGAVPQKCSTCAMLFEGSCVRYAAEVGRYMHLDHGPCGVPGPTDPVVYEDPSVVAKVEIPRKCQTCVHLEVDRIHGFFCAKDREVWGDFHRGLDWGAWAPDEVYLELPSPKLTTRELSRCAWRDDLVGFVREYRRINPGISLAEAREDFAHLRSIVERDGDGWKPAT